MLAALFAVGIIGLGLAGAGTASAVSCPGQTDPTNDIIYCGVSSVQDLINKYDNGVPGEDTHASIANVYGYGGWTNYGGQPVTSDMIHDMANGGTDGFSVSLGSVNKNNQVEDASGKVVADNVWSVGRQYISPGNPNDCHTNNGTYFCIRHPNVSFINFSLSAYVVMKDGQFQFAIMTSCGNMIVGHPTTPPTPKPTCKCVSLDESSNSDDTVFNFTAHGTADHATLTGYLYTVLDGSGKTIESKQVGTDGKFTFTETTPGNYTIEAQTIATAGGKTILSELTSDCEKHITVQTPTCQCVKVSVDQTSANDFIFHATGSVGGGATLTGFLYTILDANGNVVTTHQTDANGVWDYTQTTPGAYTVEAVAQAKTPSGATITSSLTADCKKPFKVPAPQEQFAACVELDATMPDANGNVNFTAIESHSSGEQMTSLTVDFGDHSTPFSATTDSPAPNTPNTFETTTSHQYSTNVSTAMTYTAVLTVNYKDTTNNTTSTSDNCTATITITPPTPTPTCQNGGLTGSQCEVCSNGQIQVNGQCETPSCANGGVTGSTCEVTPTAPLPSTGASDDIPAAALGLSSTVTAAGYYIRSRRSLLQNANFKEIWKYIRR